MFKRIQAIRSNPLLRKRVSFGILMLVIAGFILIFIPRMPQKFVVKAELSSDIRQRVGALEIRCLFEGNEIKTLKRYYYQKDAPELVSLEAKSPKGVIEIQIKAFAEPEASSELFSQTQFVELYGDETFTFYVKPKY